MKKNSLKETLFLKCVKYIKIVSNKNVSDFVCPICLSQFKIDSLKGENITIEHLPPKSIKGKLKILTCKKCNQNLGSKLDSQIANMDQMKNSLEFFKTSHGSYYGSAIFEFNSTKLNAELNGIDSNILVKLKPEINNPNNLDYFKRNVQKIHKFKLSPKTYYNQRLANVSLLKNSYLIAFSAFGYSYILSENLSIVRNQINNFNENIIGVFTLMQPGYKGLELYKIESPFSGIGVRIDDISVFLPWFNSPIDFYDYLSNNFNGRKMNIDYIPLKWPKTLEFYCDKIIEKLNSANTASAE